MRTTGNIISYDLKAMPGVKRQGAERGGVMIERSRQGAGGVAHSRQLGFVHTKYLCILSESSQLRQMVQIVPRQHPDGDIDRERTAFGVLDLRQPVFQAESGVKR